MGSLFNVFFPQTLAGVVLGVIAYYVLFPKHRKEQRHQWAAALIAVLVGTVFVGPVVFAVSRSDQPIVYVCAVGYILLAVALRGAMSPKVSAEKGAPAVIAAKPRDGYEREGFALGVEGKSIGPEAEVLLRHQETYRIVIANKKDVRCDAVLSVDGAPIGTIRLGPNSSQVLERPVTANGKFTFYAFDTPDSLLAGVSRSNPDVGKIRAEFRPERIREPAPVVLQSRARPTGGTGLSGKSEQKFTRVEAIEYDENEVVQIVLTLALLDDTPRPLPR